MANLKVAFCSLGNAPKMGLWDNRLDKANVFGRFWVKILVQT